MTRRTMSIVRPWGALLVSVVMLTACAAPALADDPNGGAGGAEQTWTGEDGAGGESPCEAHPTDGIAFPSLYTDPTYHAQEAIQGLAEAVIESKREQDPEFDVFWHDFKVGLAKTPVPGTRGEANLYQVGDLLLWGWWWDDENDFTWVPEYNMTIPDEDPLGTAIKDAADDAVGGEAVTVRLPIKPSEVLDGWWWVTVNVYVKFPAKVAETVHENTGWTLTDIGCATDPAFLPEAIRHLMGTLSEHEERPGTIAVKVPWTRLASESDDGSGGTPDVGGDPGGDGGAVVVISWSKGGEEEPGGYDGGDGGGGFDGGYDGGFDGDLGGGFDGWGEDPGGEDGSGDSGEATDTGSDNWDYDEAEGGAPGWCGGEAGCGEGSGGTIGEIPWPGTGDTGSGGSTGGTTGGTGGGDPDCEDGEDAVAEGDAGAVMEKPPC